MTAARTETGLGSSYLKLWIAGTVSNLGDGIEQVALPLLTATITRDPIAFAGVTLASRLPWLLVALPAGVLIDSVDRRKLVVWVDSGRALLVGLLAVAVATDTVSIAMLYALAFCLGVGEVTADTARQVLLPSLVSKDDLERANGRLFGAEIVSNQFIGPPAGGVLFAAAFVLPFAVDAGSFALGALCVFLIPGHFTPTSAEGATSSLRARIGEGMRWLWNHRLLRTLALLGAVMNATWTAGFAVLALIALDDFGMSGLGYGLLLSTSGVGYALGSFSAERLLGHLPRRVWLVSAAASLAATAFLIAATDATAVIGTLLAGFGFLSATWDVTAVSLRQSTTPDELFGRVNASYRFIQWGAMPVGAVIGGALANGFGLRAPWLVGAVCVSLASLAAWPALGDVG